jgi:hypothetical protein
VSERPNRDTPAGRAFLDLQNLARKQRRPTDELHQLYALEGFLTRLVASPHADKFVLKGGVLLAAYDTRRPTRDVDMQAHALTNDADTILKVVEEIAAQPSNDGLQFDAASATAEVIRDQDEYTGVRVTLTGRLSAARITMHIDVNVGDPIWPAPNPVALPRLLGGHIDIDGYPLVMVLAEKLVTAIQRGAANTRWRDFTDIYLLASRHPISGAYLHQSMNIVASHRQAELRPLVDVLAGFAEIAQDRWTTWRRRQRLDDRLPESFSDVLAFIIAFADPVIDGQARAATWDPTAMTWQLAS